MRSGRAASWCWVVAVAAVAATACEVEEPNRAVGSSTGYPAPAVDLGVPGAPLPDGFVVSPGSALLGPLLVDKAHENGDPAAWTARLVVDGDPLETWDAYQGQAAALGMAVTDLNQHGMGCIAYSSGLACSNWLNLDPENLERWVDMRLVRLPDDRDNRYLLTIATAGLGGALVPGRWLSEQFDEHPTGQLPAPPPSAAPTIGDQLGRDTAVLAEELTLLEETRLVAYIGPGEATGAVEVLLAVQQGADAPALMAAYEGQCERTVGGSITNTSVIDYDGDRQRTTARGAAGIGACTVTVSDSRDGIDYFVLRYLRD